ncbi:hypothetical protein GCM10009676_18660 [Prauserella halophila]|uniref:Uncharacterized protein n=1 Tax=Prauserella halophila TaxID=185641 RepID=A0ABP4GTQ1_9PSEU|nr:hypothetical protein [Prauserella halophila]MCP2235932.1 hypothetical protein [Prauserella halophila]
MTELPDRREPGSRLAAPLRSNSGAVRAGVITPAEPLWPSTDPEATGDPYADHLQHVLDGLNALGTPNDEQEGLHR